MKYDKIRGKSVSECMMKLRSLYGNAAIILSTREVHDGGLLGTGLMSKKMYEIDFMLQEESGSGRGRSALREALEKGAGQRKSPSIGSSSNFVPPEPEPAREPTPPAAVRNAPPKNLLEAAAPTSPGGQSSRDETDTGEPDPAEAAAEILALMQAAEKASLERQPEEPPPALEPPATQHRGAEPPVRSSAGRPAGAPDRYFQDIRERLEDASLSGDYIENFVRGLDEALSQLEKREFRRVEEKSLEQLAASIRTAPDIAPPPGECRAVMFIGPTGSGKTTSLAKVAARYHIYDSREVSLYSLDHYRLAATEQLKTYATVMGTPFFAPLNPEEFREYTLRDGAELLLIDTSGISYRDAGRLDDLKNFVDACEVRLEKHLVLAANTSPALLEKIVLAYDRLGFDKIILTKLDETDFIGAFVELADKFNRPFSFLMNGQDVPGDMLQPGPMDLARMVLRLDRSRKEGLKT